MKTSAGTLLYRKQPQGVEVLIVHPSGNYNAKAPWSIPKGIPNNGEELEAAARRETEEETGVVASHLVPVGHADLPSKKRVFCFVGEAPKQSTPRLASWEVDKAEFVEIEEARRRLHPNLAVFISRLQEVMARVST